MSQGEVWKLSCVFESGEETKVSNWTPAYSDDIVSEMGFRNFFMVFYEMFLVRKTCPEVIQNIFRMFQTQSG